MNSKKNIILFTASFPYGIGEQFLETEIIYLANSFETIYIIPTDKTGNKKVMPHNCIVLDIDVIFKPQKKIRNYVFSNLKTILKVFIFTIIKSKDRTRYLSDFKNTIIKLTFEIELAKKIGSQIDKYLRHVDIIYFYWFINPVFQFSVLKNQKKINQHLICRAHGYDYDEQQGRFPIYREYELKSISKVLTVSNYGLNYLKKRYDNITFNSSISYLATNDNGINPVNYNDSLHIVSCSMFHPVKRVHLIIDILKEFSINVKWTHFGSGQLESFIHNKAKELPSNINVNFKGLVDNNTIIEFYKTNPIDFFINVSELEGIPVSIMEAISFGIPVIGCDICGVPEIVNAKTGYLIEENFNPKEVAKTLMMHHNKPLQEKIEFTKKVKLFWEENFNAEINYTQFINSTLLNKA